MRKEQLTLIIRRNELEKIVSGEKVEDYRANSDYYCRIFKELGERSEVIDPPKTILFRAGYSLTSPFAIVEVDKIVFEQFINFIPEEFEKGDLAYTIYIKKVVKHNL